MKYQLIHFFSRISNLLRQNKDRKKEWNRYIELSKDLPTISRKNSAQTLMVRLDDIGDFILFAAAFKTWIQEQKSGIIFLGNIAWKTYFETLIPSEKITSIWLDKNKWFNSTDYRKTIIQQLEHYAPEHVIYASYTRVLLLEGIIKKCLVQARHIGWESKAGKFCEELNSGFDLLLKRIDGKHETENNLLLLEAIHQKSFDTEYYIEFPLQEQLIDGQYFIICPGGNQRSKQWPTEKFSEIGKFILEYKRGITCVIVGGNNDMRNAMKIEKGLSNFKVINLCGKTNLIELAEICKNAAFAISNDTSAAHLCALQKTPVFVVLNGNRFGRFFPYPKQFKHVYAIYPDLEQAAYDWEEKMPISAVSLTKLKETILQSGL